MLFRHPVLALQIAPRLAEIALMTAIVGVLLSFCAVTLYANWETVSPGYWDPGYPFTGQPNLNLHSMHLD